MSLPTLKRIRIATLLFPPLGLLWIWTSPELRRSQRAVGTATAILYSLLYCAGGVALLMRFAGLEVEWRGGFPPVLTFHKTKPNYDAVASHRRKQGAAPLPRQAEAAVPGGGVYWTDFRGPNRDGHYDERPILTNWPAGGLPRLWSQPIGGGYASFVIAGGRAFTIEQRETAEAVTAYDLATGRELWADAHPGLFTESMGGDGPRATPTYHAGRIYSLGALGELRCLEAVTGKLLWRTNVLDDAMATCLYFGMSASPLIVQDKVVVLSGKPMPAASGRTHHTVLAYDAATGRRAWSALDEQLAYASPMQVDLAGVRQLLVATARRIVGLNPGNGALLWQIPWRVQYDNTIAQPVLIGTNRFLVSGGYGAGAMAVEIAHSGGGLEAREVWRNQNLKNKFNSSVAWQGYIYGLDEGILTCLDAATGRRQWKDGRYGYGQVLLASGHLVVLSGDGELILVRASPERLEERARFRALPGKCWNHPAMADGRLLVRNAVEMACFGIDPAQK